MRSISIAGEVGTLKWLAGSGSKRHVANDAHNFVVTYALVNPVHVPYSDDHHVPPVWTCTVTLPVTLGNIEEIDVLHVPSLLFNLVSLSAPAKMNHATTIESLFGDVVFSPKVKPYQLPR